MRLSCSSAAHTFCLDPFGTDLVPLDYHTEAALFRLKEAKANPHAAYGLSSPSGHKSFGLGIKIIPLPT